MDQAGADIRGFGRFADPAAEILSALSDGPKSGVQLTDELCVRCRPVRPGTLYAALARLESQGLIEAVEGNAGRGRYRLASVDESA